MAIFSRSSSVAAMQQRLREKAGDWFFYHREVRSIFSNSLFRAVLTPEEEAVVKAVKGQAKYYIPQKDLQGGPVLDLVFRPVILQPKEASREQNKALDSGTNPPEIERLVSLVSDYCLGLKLPGAGGGVYLYMVAKDPEAAARIRKILTEKALSDKARFVDMDLSLTGLEISRS